jgi:hypothetical protein
LTIVMSRLTANAASSREARISGLFRATREVLKD